MSERIFQLKPGAEFKYRGFAYTRSRSLCGNARDASGREWQFHLDAAPDGVPGGQEHAPIPCDEFECPNCLAPLIQPRDGKNYCDHCGWPDNKRKPVITRYMVDAGPIKK